MGDYGGGGGARRRVADLPGRELDRSRPFFVGLLWELYGWVPATDHYAPDLLERQPWLDELRGGESVTELEILHGVLNDPKMAGRALFYFRSSVYAGKKGGAYTFRHVLAWLNLLCA